MCLWGQRVHCAKSAGGDKEEVMVRLVSDNAMKLAVAGVVVLGAVGLLGQAAFADHDELGGAAVAQRGLQVDPAGVDQWREARAGRTKIAKRA